jgi:hypothetical protein
MSDDYFGVVEEAISHIESELTIVGAKVVCSAASYEGIASTVPAIPRHGVWWPNSEAFRPSRCQMAYTKPSVTEVAVRLTNSESLRRARKTTS